MPSPESLPQRESQAPEDKLRTKGWFRPAGGIAFLCFIVVALLSLGHMTLGVFWTNHDIYDDSGYNLAIFRGMAGGGRLYETVLSNYGPFHYEAWLLWFRAWHFPIDHDHVALGVALIWLFAVAVAGWLAWRFCRKNLWVTAGIIFWSAWSLIALTREWGHPKSLAVALCVVMLAGVAVALRRNSRMAWALVGTAAGCLLLTKVNHGAFALAALALGFWIHLAPRRWMVPAAGLLAAAVPFCLLWTGWSLECRLLLAASVGLSIAMTMQIGGSLLRGSSDRTIRWSDAGVCFGACALAVLTVLWVATTTGSGWTSLARGIFLRPLEFTRFFQIAPTPAKEDWAILAIALLLAIGWQIPALRRRPMIWQVSLVAVVLSRFYMIQINNLTYLLTGGSLLWLAMAAQEGNRENDPDSTHWRDWLPFATLIAVWQILSLFPVYGSQSCLPMYLDVCVLGLALGHSLLRQHAALPRPGVVWAQRSFVVLWAIGLVALGVKTGAQDQEKIENCTLSGCKGASWLLWPKDQTAVLRCVTANLKNCEGPVFTLHSQPSFTLWADKPFASGMNGTHIPGMMRPSEEEAMLRSYENRAHWSALVLGDGSMFFHPYRNAVTTPFLMEKERFDVAAVFRDVDKITQWLAVKTDPWMSVNGYHLRLSKGTPPKPPVDALWKQQGTWMMSFPESILPKIRKAELHAVAPGPWIGLPAGSKPVGYLKWEAKPWQKADGTEDMLQGPVPAPMATTLDQHPFVERCLWLLDSDSHALAMLPLVVMERPLDHP